MKKFILKFQIKKKKLKFSIIIKESKLISLMIHLNKFFQNKEKNLNKILKHQENQF